MLHGPQGMAGGDGRRGRKNGGGGRQKVEEGDFRPPVRISRILYHVSEGLEKGLSIGAYGAPVLLDREGGCDLWASSSVSVSWDHVRNANSSPTPDLLNWSLWG